MNVKVQYVVCRERIRARRVFVALLSKVQSGYSSPECHLAGKGEEKKEEVASAIAERIS